MKLIITQQGVPVVYDGSLMVVAHTSTVVCAYIKTTARLSEVGSINNLGANCPGLMLRSIEPGVDTVIEFPDLNGWNVFSYNLIGKHCVAFTVTSEEMRLLR
jgi:hypothetical protein